ncbi:unnamed protein product [Phyllotreta striolata]|uniref:Ubiquinone biosynthesis monooxygenase COQ6, mitochondrial n=1 Tax=Phyllotreta striolata TaxID=444603 RepID=A0A9N9XQT4_PHYSR|nr:unnamed protein product [Phyllotreta striolata]
MTRLAICKQAIATNTKFFTKRSFSSSGLEANSSKYYDIVIAGGGMIGCSLACTLGANQKLSNKRILLLESSKNKQYIPSEKYSNRVVSINPGNKKLLDNIGAWKHIESNKYATVKRLQVMDAISDTSITFGEETSSKDISYIVENDLLIHAVKTEMEQAKNVEVQYNQRIKSYNLPKESGEMAKICLEDGSEYTCDLLVGCDGQNSQVRKAMGVNYLNWKYDNVGIVATLKFNEEIDNCIAWQRLLPTGPIALLPLTSNMSSLVWSTTIAHSQQLMKLSDEQFVQAVNEGLWKVYERYGIVDQLVKSFDSFLRAANIPADVCRRYPPKIQSLEEGSRASFPLGFGHATNYISKGVALVGDAAHRVHPLAGQGVNLGFGDVQCLNKVLGEAHYVGCSLGNVFCLKDYESERQKYNVKMMIAVEGLYRLYRTDSTPVVIVRSLGLQATDVLFPIKNMIIEEAST